MDLSTSAVVFLFLTYHFCEAADRKYNSVLTVSNGGKWGEWGKIEFCAEGYAKGFSLKVAIAKGVGHDNSALNGIQLYCSSGDSITSTVGPFGSWRFSKDCPKGYMVAFALRVQSPQGPLDDTAANDIRFNCGDGGLLKGNGHDLGDFGEWSETCKAGAICGMQTKVEGKVRVDNTALNDVKFFCCD